MHPFYVSICQIDYNEQNSSLEISVKIFADDLLIALENRKLKDLHLGEKQENPKTDEIVFNYLKEKLSVRTDDKTCNFSFVGKEIEDNAVWCYLEVTEVSPFKKIEVTNGILTEIYDAQNNIIQVENKGKILNLLLKKDNQTGELIF